ncbi:MAG: hypothetical protein IJ640_13355 [Prevotella sp.]|nr:hypothetical protein [Prevotella sp.]
MIQHLLTTIELRKLGRPIGKVADEKLNAVISEAEQLHIKPILGDELFLDLLKEASLEDEEEKDTTKQMLLNGGSYYINKDTDKEAIRSFMGLKVALSYFVYAQNLMVGDIESTRYGSVIKENDFSSRVSSKERSNAYNNTMEVANAYLKECVEYCKANGLIKSAGRPAVAIGGITIKRIG